MDIKLDLEEQLKNIILNEIKAFSTPRKRLEELSKCALIDLLLIFFNAKKRIPITNGQTVHYSKELLIDPNYINYQQEIKKIETIFENSLDIKPYLSKEIKHLFEEIKPDHLLNDWGIHHIHFKTGISELLFCIVQNKDVYFIGIWPHKEWVNLDIVKRIKENWPTLMMPTLHYDKVLTPVLENGKSVKINKSEYSHLQKHGILSLMNDDKFTIFSQISNDSYSFTDKLYVNNLIRKIKITKLLVEQNIDVLFNQYIMTGQVSNLDFILCNPFTKEMYLYEKNTNLSIDVDTTNFFAKIFDGKILKVIKINPPILPTTHQTHPQQNEQV